LSDLAGHNDEFTEQRAVEMVRRAAAGSPETFAWPDPTNDGDLLWVEVKIQPATLDGSEYVVSSVRDISERRAQAKELKGNQAALERLQRITADPSKDLTTQLRDLLRFGADYLGTEIGFLSKIDPASDGFEIAEAVGDHPLIQSGNTAALNETYCRRTLHDDTELPLVYNDAATEGLADDPAYEKFGLGCYMGTKITVDGELYGTICFADTDPRTEPFSEMEQTILDYMSQWLQQELERREYLEEVEAAKKRNKRLFERIDDAFFGLDEDWYVQYVNDAGGDVLRQAMDTDYGNDELIGKHLWEEIPAAVETIFYEMYHRALDEQTSITFEERYDPLDVWFEVRAYPDEHGLSVFFSDITERKQREQELHILERAMEEASLPLTMADPTQEDNPMVFVNDAFEELTGYTTADVIGQNCRFLQGPDTDPETVAALRDRIDAEETFSTKIKNYRRDGSTFWNQLDVTPIYDDDGTLLRYLGSQSDITEEYRTRTIRRRLLSTTQRLMDANSREEIAEIVANAAVNILDHDPAVVYLRDYSGDKPLVPVAWPDQIDEIFGGPPEYQDDGPLVKAFETGEPVVVDDIASHPDIDAEQFQPIESLLLIPLGEYGMLGVGGYETGIFEAADIERARLLTVNATSAFSRMDRRQELEQYETLFETIQEQQYVTDSNGYIELVSQPLAEAVGYTPDKLEGMHISAITTETTDAKRRGLELDLLVTPDTVSSSYEGTLQACDGTETPVEIEVSLLPYERSFRGSVGAVRDISERRKREAELQVFQEAITEAGIGLTMYGADGTFEYVNDHYAQFVGHTRESLQDAPVWETVDELSVETFDHYWDSFAADETRTEETKHERTDGTTVPVEMTTTAVEINGTNHNLMLVQEITGRRERRQQSEVLHRVMRHNLRNDLTVVIGRIKILIKELDGSAADHAKIVRDNAENLLDTVEAAADARDVIGRDIVRKPTDVVTLLREEIDKIEESVSCTVQTDLPDSQAVLADTPLRRGLQHLLTNAVEHNDADKPAVSVRVTDTADRPGWVAVEIEDNGPGIPSGETDVLTAGEETELHHGSGIGLWVVHWVVTRYGGDLEFEVPPSGGSLVRITLPAAD
jgi:PAS domain S-box-containing protein